MEASGDLTVVIIAQTISRYNSLISSHSPDSAPALPAPSDAAGQSRPGHPGQARGQGQEVEGGRHAGGDHHHYHGHQGKLSSLQVNCTSPESSPPAKLRYFINNQMVSVEESSRIH